MLWQLANVSQGIITHMVVAAVCPKGFHRIWKEGKDPFSHVEIVPPVTVSLFRESEKV